MAHGGQHRVRRHEASRFVKLPRFVDVLSGARMLPPRVAWTASGAVEALTPLPGPPRNPTTPKHSADADGRQPRASPEAACALSRVARSTRLRGVS